MAALSKFRVPIGEWADLAMRCNDAPDQFFLFDYLMEAMSRIGGVSVSYTHFPPYGTDVKRDPLTICYAGLDDELVETYARERMWRNSENMKTAFLTGKPSYAKPDIPASHPVDRASPDARACAKAIAASIDAHDVIQFAAFGPQGRTGFYSYWLTKSENPVCADEMMILQSIGQQAHVRYCALRLEAGHGESVELTEREERCLSLYGGGLKQKEIAAEMGIPVTTVRSTLRSAGVKLGTGREDAPAALLKAVALGLVCRKGAGDGLVLFSSPSGRRTKDLGSKAA